MRVLLAVLFSILFVASTSVDASVQGLWWDPNVPGEGWTFEDQDGLVAVTWYRYESGEPAFRTAAIEAEFDSDPTSVDPDWETRLVGPVFRTTDFTNSVATGNLDIVFRYVDGRHVGSVVVEGVSRTIVPFLYAYAFRADFYRGIWTLASHGTTNVPTFASFMAFDEETVIADDGTAIRWYDLDDGTPGYFFYDAAIDRIVVALFETSGDFLSAAFLPDLSNTVGVGGYFNEAGAPISAPFWVSINALANSDREAMEMRDFLNFPDAAAKHSERPSLSTIHTVREAVRQLETRKVKAGHSGPRSQHGTR